MIPRNKYNKGALYVRGLSSNVVAQFKSVCARKQTSMNKKITELMLQFITEENKYTEQPSVRKYL